MDDMRFTTGETALLGERAAEALDAARDAVCDMAGGLAETAAGLLGASAALRAAARRVRAYRDALEASTR